MNLKNSRMFISDCFDYNYSYFTSSNISYTDYQFITFLWYKNVSSIRVVLISKHLGCYRYSYHLTSLRQFV